MVGRSRQMELKVYGVYNKITDTLWRMLFYRALKTFAILAKLISVFLFTPYLLKDCLSVLSAGWCAVSAAIHTVISVIPLTHYHMLLCKRMLSA